MTLSTVKIFLLLFFTTLPLLCLPYGFNPYEFPKFINFIACTHLALVLYLWLVMRKKAALPVVDRLTFCLLFFCLTLLLADIFGLDMNSSLIGSTYRYQGFITLITGLILYTLIRLLTLETNLSRLFTKYAIVSVLCICAVALYQAFQLYILKNPSVATYQGRIVGTFGNPNFLGGYLAILLPFLLAIKNKYIKILLIALSLFVILLSGSRAAMIASGAILMIPLFKWIKGQQLRVKIATIFLFFCTLLFFAFVYQQNIFQLQRTSQWDTRTLIWSEGIKAVTANPILGYGQENFELIFPPERHMKVDSAHNIFLEVTIAGGMAALSLFLIILYLKYKEANFTIRLAIISFLIIASFNPLSIAQISLFWILLGMKERFEV